jgi:esterase/lipase superfamily enzyme
MRRFTPTPRRTGFQRLPPARAWDRGRFACQLLCLALTAAGLAGCASPHGFLVPVAATAPGTSQVEMVVATTRTRADSPAEMFSGGRDVAPSFADITVSIPPDGSRQIGDVQWPKQIPGDPATDFVTLKADIIDQPQAISSFSRLVKNTPKRQVLVFVHGFNNRFEDAVFRFAQFIHDSRVDATPVLFTWPSRGSVFAYGYDRESANYSRDALENLLRWLSKNPQVGEVSVLAHSMGNWVTLEALRQMAIRDGRIAPKIRNVILAAPDVDFDVAREQIRTMGPQKPNFTLLVSSNDRALAASQKVWGAPRLGEINPDIEPFKSDLASDKIKVVDLTTFHSQDSLNHGTFAENPEIVQLIGRSIDSGQTLTESRVGLGEKIVQATAGAATSVGQAAALVVTAPVAIVDPVTREHYGDQLDAVGQSLQDAASPR